MELSGDSPVVYLPRPRRRRSPASGSGPAAYPDRPASPPNTPWTEAPAGCAGSPMWKYPSTRRVSTRRLWGHRPGLQRETAWEIPATYPPRRTGAHRPLPPGRRYRSTGSPRPGSGSTRPRSRTPFCPAYASGCGRGPSPPPAFPTHRRPGSGHRC